MRVNEIMSTNLKTVSAATPADDAWELMRGECIHHLVVMDGTTMMGVFSARDAGGPNGAWLRVGHSVGELMSEDVVAAAAHTPVKKVANLMSGHTIGSVVVFDKGRPVGIVTTSDLLQLLGRGAIKPNPVSKKSPLNFRAPHRKRNRAYGVW